MCASPHVSTVLPSVATSPAGRAQPSARGRRLALRPAALNALVPDWKEVPPIQSCPATGTESKERRLPKFILGLPTKEGLQDLMIQ